MISAKTKMKFASLLVMGGCVLQFGGCFGDFLQVAVRSIPVGFGQAIGATPATIVNGLITPLLGTLGGGA